MVKNMKKSLKTPRIEYQQRRPKSRFPKISGVSWVREERERERRERERER